MNHDGSLDSTVTNDGTTMTISVPEKPTVGAQQQLTELTRSRDKYKAAFQEANEAIVIVDDNGRIMDANPATSTVFGLDHQKLMGRPIAEFLSDDFEFKTEWRELLETGGERDIAPVLGIDGVDRVLEYSATADIIPGQHLFVGRDVTEQEKRRQDSRS